MVWKSNISVITNVSNDSSVVEEVSLSEVTEDKENQVKGSPKVRSVTVDARSSDNYNHQDDVTEV